MKTKNEVTHTPTPWKVAEATNEKKFCFAIVSASGWIADLYECGGDRTANAEFIVRAVNAYDELIELLDEIRMDYAIHANNKMAHRIAQAIAKAEGK